MAIEGNDWWYLGGAALGGALLGNLVSSVLKTGGRAVSTEFSRGYVKPDDLANPDARSLATGQIMLDVDKEIFFARMILLEVRYESPDVESGVAGMASVDVGGPTVQEAVDAADAWAKDHGYQSVTEWGVHTDLADSLFERFVVRKPTEVPGNRRLQGWKDATMGVDWSRFGKAVKTKRLSVPAVDNKGLEYPVSLVLQETGTDAPPEWVVKLDGTPGSWAIKTIMERGTPPAGLYIDFGSGWAWTNVRDVMDEALRAIEE